MVYVTTKIKIYIVSNIYHKCDDVKCHIAFAYTKITIQIIIHWRFRVFVFVYWYLHARRVVSLGWKQNTTIIIMFLLDVLKSLWLENLCLLLNIVVCTLVFFYAWVVVQFFLHEPWCFDNYFDDIWDSYNTKHNIIINGNAP